MSTNPFVGPQPLSGENSIFGRDRELRELKYLLTSKRIVLLYSASGAGKSSLVAGKRGLCDRLKKSFDVWPVTRVSTEAPFPVANR
jgi:predicted GTPase